MKRSLIAFIVLCVVFVVLFVVYWRQRHSGGGGGGGGGGNNSLFQGFGGGCPSGSALIPKGPSGGSLKTGVYVMNLPEMSGATLASRAMAALMQTMRIYNVNATITSPYDLSQCSGSTDAAAGALLCDGSVVPRSGTGSGSKPTKVLISVLPKQDVSFMPQLVYLKFVNKPEAQYWAAGPADAEVVTEDTTRASPFYILPAGVDGAPSCSFRFVLIHVKTGDFVYLDKNYVRLGKTATILTRDPTDNRILDASKSPNVASVVSIRASNSPFPGQPLASPWNTSSSFSGPVFDAVEILPIVSAN